MSMATEVAEIRQQSRKYPTVQGLMNRVNSYTLAEAHRAQPARKAKGVDNVTKDEYDRNLYGNLDNLVERMKKFSYRPQPVRRTYIPKANGKMRPLGIPSYEDKLVQWVMANLLTAVYEERFRDCSYGFRPGRSAHDVVKVVNDTVMSGCVGYVLEADIKGFFDNIEHDILMALLRSDIEDKNFLRYIKRFLIGGVMEDGKFLESDKGSPQGGLISPVLANVYLHYALDSWVEDEVAPKLRGFSRYVRYADDFLIMFQFKEDAEEVMELIRERMRLFALELAEEKTRILSFGRFADTKETFDFLGFTFYNTKTRKGTYRIGIKTSSKKLKQKRESVKQWLKENMHKPVANTMTTLNNKLVGHCMYYGVNGNFRCMYNFYEYVKRRVMCMLRRRSQRDKTSWEKLQRIWDWFITPPRIYVDIWHNSAVVRISQPKSGLR